MIITNNKLPRRILASVMSLVIVLSNMQPVFALLGDRDLTDTENKQALSEPAEESSLEKLVDEELIEPDYIVKRELLKEAGDYKSEGFSARFMDLMAGIPGEDDTLFESVEGLEKVRDLLQESSESDNLMNTPSDIGALDFVRSRLPATASDSEAAGDELNTLVTDITLIIEDLKPREVIEINPNPNSNLQATWTKENKVILRWQPEGSWVPKEGYNLYRVVGKQASLLASGLGLR